MTRCQPALGTYVEIQAHTDAREDAGECEAHLAHAIDHAFAAIATVQSCMSVFDPHSDLSRLNAGAYRDAPGTIHPWLWDVLTLAQTIHRLSPAFDPCAGHALVRHGVRPDPGQAVRGTLADVHLLSGHRLVTTAPVYLDLGGIAKGEAVDRAVQALQAQGVPSGCVNAGGDLRVFGPRTQPIFLRRPDSPTQLAHVGDLQEGALATSGDYFAAQADAQAPVRGHLIDPARGTFLATTHSFSVLAPRCAVADALTKVYALTGDAHHPALRHFDAHALAH